MATKKRQPKLTIGMAHNHDFSGVWATIQHIRQTTRRIREIEFIVVNTNPDTIDNEGNVLPGGQHGIDLQNFISNCERNTAGAKYVMLDHDKYGTTQGRNAVFEHAAGEIVFCIDCHISPDPFAFDRVMEWFDAHPDCKDLVQGPILNDDLSVMADHFQDVWNDEMLGVWGLTPHCLTENEKTTSIKAKEMLKRQVPVDDMWEALHADGLDQTTMQRVDEGAELEAYEIEAMGLGLFGCRKDAWLGFNEHFRGFGGEEWYIHRKYRKAGHKVLCLPWLRWLHRFCRVDTGIRYTISHDHKIRNYILGHAELGDSVAGIHQQFVKIVGFPQEKWDWIKSDPVNNIPDRTGPPAMIRSQGNPAQVNPGVDSSAVANVDMTRPQPPEGADLDTIFMWCTNTPRDLNEHLPLMKEWAEKCDHVTEFTERRESTIGFAGGRPKTFISYNIENDLLIHDQGALFAAVRAENATNEKLGIDDRLNLSVTVGHSLLVPAIEDTDLLFIDTKHNGDRLWAELEKHAKRVRRAIMIHDTVSFGEKGDDGGPGLNDALRRFVDYHPEWFVAAFDSKQYGMTVLSKDITDRPKEDISAWPPGWGPGTELKLILASIDIFPSPGCSCNAMAAQMDRWGVAGCKVPENEAKIIETMKENEESWGWKEHWETAGKLAKAQPTVFAKLVFDPTNPQRCLCRAAVKKAIATGKKRAKDLERARREYKALNT